MHIVVFFTTKYCCIITYIFIFSQWLFSRVYSLLEIGISAIILFTYVCDIYIDFFHFIKIMLFHFLE